MDELHAIETSGYCLLPDVFDSTELATMIEGVKNVLTMAAHELSVIKGQRSPAFGARNILRLWPECRSFVNKAPVSDVLRKLLGHDGGLVRGLYFDKPPGHSWALPWHRDDTIAVKKHGALGVFTKPTTKAGVPHVVAPESLLSRMIAVRIHLDAMDDENGALKVMPGSHRESSVPGNAVTITCAAGDVLLMRPLLLHASGHSAESTTRHRRIVHLECAPSPVLPDGYQWHDYQPIDANC